MSSQRPARKRRHPVLGYPAFSPTEQNRCRVKIDILPDDVLLEIFDFCVVEANEFKPDNRWQTLVHVCRKWRNLIFESPRRLNLRLVCSERTPVRETLDVWPPLPIIISHIGHSKYSTSGRNDIVAALEHHDRVRQITLRLFNPESKSILEATQKPFPALTSLVILSNVKTAPVIPDSFLGGSAPRLQFLSFKRILFPGLSKLLLSATGLVYLDLRNTPHSGYISPGAMATCLSVLTRLKVFHLEFESPRSRPDRESRPPPPPTRSVLPALVRLDFTGVSKYLDDLVARIDAPRLKRLGIKFFRRLTFDTPQLIQFITRTPNLKTCDQAHVYFSNSDVSVTFPRTPSDADNGLKSAISCRRSEWKLSAVAQVCNSCFPRSLIHMVERLYIREGSHSWQDNVENNHWLGLLHPFMAAKHLYLSKKLVPLIAPSLQELVGERVTEVLPALQNLFLEELHPSGAVEEDIGKFVATR